MSSFLFSIFSISFQIKNQNHHAQGEIKGLGCVVEGEVARAERRAEVASSSRRRRGVVVDEAKQSRRDGGMAVRGSLFFL